MANDPAQRIIELLERRPKLLNSVVLRLLEQGCVADNLAYMHHKLDIKIALPWLKDDSGPYWFRRRYGTTTDRENLVAEVVTVEGDIAPTCYEWMAMPAIDESEDAKTPMEAMKAADAQLQKNGWILL